MWAKLTPAVLLALCLSWPAQAQTTSCTGPTGANCVPVVPFTASGVISSSNPLQVQQVANTAGAAGYPTGATPVGGTFSGADTTSQVATVPSGGGLKFTYICGFTVSGLGATSATPVSVTVATLTGPVSPIYSYVFVAGATLLNTFLAVQFSPCIPASAANTGITVTVPGAAGNTATQINAWGFQL